jgi:hypothetical protein
VLATHVEGTESSDLHWLAKGSVWGQDETPARARRWAAEKRRDHRDAEKRFPARRENEQLVNNAAALLFFTFQ